MTRSLLAAAALLLAACDTTETSPATAPTPPPAAAFTFDTSSFPDDARAASGPHFANAALRVGIVTGVIGIHLALPHLATDAVASVTPTVENGVWLWNALRVVNGQPIRLRLSGTPAGQTVAWRMETAGGTDPFATFYTGTTALDGRSGSWRLFYPDAPEGASDGVLSATFNVPTDTRRTLGFAIPDGRDGAGSEVDYVADGDSRRFDWTRQPEGIRTVVAWNEPTGAGWIEADDYNGGGRACWDSDRQDSPCTAN